MNIYSIYRFQNIISGKIYIGQTKNKPTWRFADHVRAADTGTGHLLAAAIRKYGIDNFTFEVIFNAFTSADLNQAEKDFIVEYDCCVLDGADKGYNVDRGGSGVDAELVRAAQKAKVADGTHIWASPDHAILSSLNQLKRFDSGTHHFTSEFATSRNIKLIAEGRHYGSSPEAAKAMSEWNRERIEAGTHHLIQTRTCPHCGKTGSGAGMNTYHFDKCKKSSTYDESKDKNSSYWLVTFPEGHVVKIKNMKQFCKEHGLSSGGMSEVASGKKKHYKGFTCTKA